MNCQTSFQRPNESCSCRRGGSWPTDARKRCCKPRAWANCLGLRWNSVAAATEFHLKPKQFAQALGLQHLFLASVGHDPPLRHEHDSFGLWNDVWQFMSHKNN